MNVFSRSIVFPLSPMTILQASLSRGTRGRSNSNGDLITRVVFMVFVVVKHQLMELNLVTLT